MHFFREMLDHHLPQGASAREAPRHDADVTWAERLSAAQAPHPGSAPKAARPKDELLFIGMSDGSAEEVATLRQTTRVVAAMDSAKDDHVTVGRRSYDLANGDASETFLVAIGVSEDKIAPLRLLIAGTNSDARDEVGQIIRVYQQAEAGARVLDRVVVSGHSAGGSVWGDHNGVLDMEIMAQLAAIFPGAASQVRDLMISGCFTGGEGKMDRYHQWFPRLESIWAYSSSSPGTYSGATQHMRVWERATRARDKPADMDQAHKQVAKTALGSSVATWTAADGYVGEDGALTIEDARNAVLADEGVYEAFASGAQESKDPGSGPLYEYYRKLHRLVGHLAIDPAEKQRWGLRIESVVRLRYWGKVMGHFASQHGAKLAAGYRAAHRAEPRWSSLPRAALFTEADAMWSLRGHGPEAELASTLLIALRELDPTLIPPQWL